MEFKREWAQKPFTGSSEGIIPYINFKEYINRTIDDKGVRSALDEDVTSTAGATRDAEHLKKLLSKNQPTSDDHSTIAIIEKKFSIKKKERKENDDEARIIIGIISSACTGDPLNIVDRHIGEGKTHF
jgi:hypothetical protein